MTFLEKFEELKSICDGLDIKFDRDFAVQINMTDSDCGGVYYIEHRDGVVNVEPYDYHDNNAVMTADSAILEKMLTGEIDSIAAFFAGKFAIDGDVEAVLQLTKIADAVKAKKKAEEKAKKEAEKKAKAEAEKKAKAEAEKKAKAEAEAKAKKEAEEKAKKEAEKAAKEAKKAEEKAKKEAEKKAKAEAEAKAKKEAEKKEVKKAPAKKTAEKKTTKKTAEKEEKQMKLDI